MCCATSAGELVFSAGSCLVRMMFLLFLSAGIISTFLHVHPFGASIEYICSYLQRLDSKVGVLALPGPPRPPSQPGWCVCAPSVFGLCTTPSLGVGWGLHSKNWCVLTGIISYKRMGEGVNSLKITEAFELGGTFKDHLVHPLGLQGASTIHILHTPGLLQKL